MNVSLKPDTAKYIEDQVRTGNFPSADQLVEEAVARLKFETEFELDEATIQAIQEAEAQADRGEVMELAEFRAAFYKQMKLPK